MASGYNRVVLVGNLTRDPELRQLPSGQAVCRLNLAINRQFKNRQTGDMVQEVCYIDIDVWGPQAESCSNYLQKGRQALVEGRLKLDSWQDNDGNNRSKHSVVADRVVFLSSGQQQDQLEGKESDLLEAMEPRNQMERELMSQLDQVKNRASKTSDSSKKGPKTVAADAPFLSDEPAFKDDLPF
jgi:single-strand DNA-binding protein